MNIISIKKYQEEPYYLDKGLTDCLKIISCILVAASHYASMQISEGVSVNLFSKVISSQGGYLGVAIFFFLSGFGIMSSLMHNKFSFAQYLLRRIKKVYFPVVFVSLIWVVFFCVFPL